MEPYQNTQLSPEARAEDLLSRMTLREKVGQLNQRLYGFQIYTREGEKIALTQEFADEVARYDGLGALYGLHRADPWSAKDFETGLSGRLAVRARNQVQRYVIEHSRFGIPVLFSSECPHGHQVLDGYLLPVNLASACSFSPEFLREAAEVGTGTVGAGGCNLSLGTSGTISISSKVFGVDPNNALHAFAHADGGYHLMGCMLSAASCNQWFCENVLNTTNYAEEQAKIAEEKLGENHVYFLPYLMGERSPINDTNARGAFIGMSMDTSRADFVQAVLEGVAFAIRDSFEVAKSLEIEIPRSKICGGGAKSPLWRRIFANVLGIPLDMVKTEQGPGYGAAMLAMVGCGAFASVQAAADALVEVASATEPDAELTAKYQARYEKFKQLYPALKSVFSERN